MRTLLSLLLVLSFGGSSAQRILYTSQDLNRPYDGRPIDAIHPHWLAGGFATKITIVYKDGEKQKISRDSIWGFEDSTHSIYRSYQGELYEMKPKDDLLMYISASSRYRFPYYSKTLDGPLYGTKRQARKDIASNP